MLQKIYGKSENGNILCLGIRLEDGSIGEMPCLGSRVNNKLLIGNRIVFYNKIKDKYYDINVLDYIETKNKRFIVKYEEEPEKEIICSGLINKCKIKNVINEKINKFYQKDDYWVMTIKTRGTKWEKDFNGETLEILFDGENEVINSIINSSWHLHKNGKGLETYYIQTASYNKSGRNIKLHQVVYGEKAPKGYVINHIKRGEGSWRDNRKSNLEIISLNQNTKNKAGVGFPRKDGKSWRYEIRIDGAIASTPGRREYGQSDLDALIVQQYYGYTHRKNEWHKIDKVDEKYKQKLIQIMKNKFEKARIQQGDFTKNSFELFLLDGIETAKIYDTKKRYTLIDKEDLWILEKGRIRQRSTVHWEIKVNKKEIALHRYILGIDKTNSSLGVNIDHINRQRNDNRKNNLIITTHKGNMANVEGMGYNKTNCCSYQVTYKCFYNILKQHKDISDIKHPTFKIEQEAKEEVYKRKYLANRIRPQFKDYNEYLVFEEEYNTNKKDGQAIDDYWITTRFPNINDIEIPKYI